MLDRRSLLRGLFAAPAIVAASSLMPLRGVSLILPRELSTEEILALLDRRIDASFVTAPRPWRHAGYEIRDAYMEARCGAINA